MVYMLAHRYRPFMVVVETRGAGEWWRTTAIWIIGIIPPFALTSWNTGITHIWSLLLKWVLYSWIQTLKLIRTGGYWHREVRYTVLDTYGDADIHWGGYYCVSSYVSTWQRRISKHAQQNDWDFLLLLNMTFWAQIFIHRGPVDHQC